MQIALRMFGREIELRTKLLQLAPLSSSGSWWPVVRDAFTGAWQRNVTVDAGTALSYSAVYACITLIAADIAKLCLRLVQEDSDGIWTEADNPAYSPVLRKPNRYQNTVKFIEQWIVSKLSRGNTYVLKGRDQRGVVTALYVLDPNRIKPLVTPDGAVYYEIRRDDLSGLQQESITVPAREVIHDIMCALWHPLIGVTPIYACGSAAIQGLAIQNNSQRFFMNGSMPGAILTAPAGITDTQAERLETTWNTKFAGDSFGKIAILGGDLKFNPLTMNAVDAQLIEQLKWSAETVCSCFHVPPYMIGVGPPPPYANVEPLLQAYYAQCIQSLITSLEKCLDEGLGLGADFGNQYGVEFDIDDLIWMDTATRTKAANDGITGGLSFNEVRKKYYGYGPVKGGESPMSQQQNFSIAALAERDANQPFAKPAPAPQQQPPNTPAADQQMAASFESALRRKALERWPRAA